MRKFIARALFWTGAPFIMVWAFLFCVSLYIRFGFTEGDKKIEEISLSVDKIINDTVK